jgi:predicted DNA-binding transcriptional regulator YafY
MVYRPTARVLAVLEMLQSSGHMTGQEIAAKLEVDVRTARRYITTLQDIGIPIESEIGRYGGYAIRPGFKLPPLMFTDDEVLILTLGLLLARGAGLSGAKAAAESALAKVDRVLPVALQEQLRALTETMQLDNPLYPSTVDGDVLSNLSLASRQRRQVRLAYRTRETPTERIFDPYAVIYHQDRWYTVGYCHLRHERRVFRLDRVQHVALLETAFTTPPDFDALDYMLSSFEAIPDLWNVDVLLEMPLDAARQAVPRELATLIETDRGTQLRASIHDLGYMARVLIGLGCPLKAIRPPELRTELLSIAARVSQYAQGDGAP